MNSKFWKGLIYELLLFFGFSIVNWILIFALPTPSKLDFISSEYVLESLDKFQTVDEGIEARIKKYIFESNDLESLINNIKTNN